MDAAQELGLRPWLAALPLRERRLRARLLMVYSSLRVGVGPVSARRIVPQRAEDDRQGTPILPQQPIDGEMWHISLFVLHLTIFWHSLLPQDSDNLRVPPTLCDCRHAQHRTRAASRH